MAPGGVHRHRSGIPNSNQPGNTRPAAKYDPQPKGLRKDQSTKQIGQGSNPNALQQYHLNQLQVNSHANSRLSSSKPILGGGVAGAKYLQHLPGQPSNGELAGPHSKLSPQTKSGAGPPSSGMNSKIVRESMSLNHSALKQQASHGLKGLAGKGMG